MRAFLLFAATLLIVEVAVSQTSSSPAHQGATARPTPPRSPKAASAAPPPLVSDDQKTIYALGLSIYRSLSQFDLSPAELEIVKRAMADAAANKPAEDLRLWGPKIQGFAQSRGAQVAERQKTASAAYLSKAASQPGAVKTASGMVYRELALGTGLSPKPTDQVKVNYRGTLVDGTEFDSSYSRHEPAQFPLNGVIPCWTEGLQMMKPGGKAQLVCPANLAYGDQGRPGIPPGATLLFDVELLQVLGPTTQ